MNANGQKTTGAAAKAARQAKLTVVQTPTPEQAPEFNETAYAEIVAATVAAAQGTGETVDLAALQAAKRALDAQIRAAKGTTATTAKPATPTKTLETVIEKQTEQPKKWPAVGIAEFVDQRERVGQPRAEALEGVLDQYRVICMEVLTMREANEAVRDATDRWLAANAPKVAEQVASMTKIMLGRSATTRERGGDEQAAE